MLYCCINQNWAKNIIWRIFQVLGAIYPAQPILYNYLLSARSDSKWMSELESMAGKLSTRRKWKYICFFVGTYYTARVKRLRQYAFRGREAPVFAMISLTPRCNIQCQYCIGKKYSRDEYFDEISLIKILNQCVEYGISNYVLLGGEPFLFSSLTSIPRQFINEYFYVFTNGTIITEQQMKEIIELKNIMLVISSDISENYISAGRKPLLDALEQNLINNQVVYAKSIIIHKNNWKELMNSSIRNTMFSDMCRFALLVHYYGENIDYKLTEEQRKQFNENIVKHRKYDQGVILLFPEDEKRIFGGCSGGKKFFHIAPDGSVESCPFYGKRLGHLSDSHINELLLHTSQDNRSDQMGVLPCAS